MSSTFQPGISTHLIIQERMFSMNTEIAVGQNCKAKLIYSRLQSHNQGLFLLFPEKIYAIEVLTQINSLKEQKSNKSSMVKY